MVELSLRRVGSRTVLSVRDNGLGFDTEASRGAEHLGLKIMRDTIRETGGSLEVRSAPGKGTEIVAALRRHGSAHADQ
jgi:signal transduction histidine kinase